MISTYCYCAIVAITFISSGRVLRVLRILRVFRVLRGAEVFEGLRLVAKTIIISIPDMLNIGLLLLILMFVFAIVGVTVFKPYSPDYFGDLSKGISTIETFQVRCTYVIDVEMICSNVCVMDHVYI